MIFDSTGGVMCIFEYTWGGEAVYSIIHVSY